MESPKHILLVSYVFPPYYGIGGRRWAKHASELTKMGYVVHVICAKNPFDKESLWWDLVKNNENIKIYCLPRMYPKVLVKFEHNFIQKILYKFWIFILPFLTKGSYLDRTIFWERVMLRKAKKIILENRINHVICTGAPFGVMFQVTKLRKWFHNIFIMNDLRDPWTWGPNWGFPNLEKKRMAHELLLEGNMIKNSDLITVPTLEMKKSLDTTYPEFAHKVKLLQHFVDINEIVVLEKTASEKVRLIMYGNIYHHIPELIEETARVIGNYKDQLILDIYTDKHQHKQTFSKYGATNVTFYDQLPEKELFSKFQHYDYVFLMIPGVGVDHISTKFYEIIYSKTPFLILCKDGLGPQFIVNNKLGIHAELNQLSKTFDMLVKNKKLIDYNTSFDVGPYTLNNNAKQIEVILKENNNFTHIRQRKTRNVLITFDYELFLGIRSGSLDNCIIKPTNLILDLLEKQKIKKALFFVDTIYIKRLLEIQHENTKADYLKIEAQLTSILQKGHIIFPHLHPHWIDANYLEKINQWELLNIGKYRFHNIDRETREELFDFSIEFIKKIQQKAGVFYDISGYRAGGWCLQPFRDFKPLFIKHNIKNDFSVLKNFKKFSENVYYNYTKVPRKDIYNFNDHVELEEINGPFKEYSISYIEIKNKIINRLFLKYLSIRGIQNLGDGISVSHTEEQIIKDIDEGIVNNQGAVIEMISVELLKSLKMKAYKQLIHNNMYTHFISHPKMLSSHNIKCFDELLTYLKTKYTLECDFEKMNL